MHGARVIALRANFDQALRDRPRAGRQAPGRARQLGQPLPDRGPEDGGVRGRRGARRAARRARDPGRQRGQRHRVAAGLRRARRRAAALRLPGRGRRAAGPRRPGRRPGDDRLGDQDREPGAVGGGDGRLHQLPGPRRGGHRRSDPRRLQAARLARGGVLRAGLRGLGRGDPRARAARAREGQAAPETVVCVLTGHGLKDPDTALSKAPAVIGCEPELAAVERAVFD